MAATSLLGLDVAALEASPLRAPALFLITLGGAVCPVPGLFSSSLFAAGFALGFWPGFCTVYPAAVLGACASFATGRWLGASLQHRVPAKVASRCAALGDGGFTTLLLLRLTPLTVCASAAFLGSVPTVSARQHAAASAVGFVRLALHVYIGASLRLVSSGDSSQAERWASMGGAVAVALCVGNVARLLLRGAQAPLAPYAEIEAYLLESMRAVPPATDDAIMEWMQSRIDSATPDASAVRVVMRCLLEASSEETPPSWAKLTDAITKRAKLLRNFVHVGKESEQMTLMCASLYEVQAYCMRKGWPDKLMKKLFYQLYEADVVLEEAYAVWREDTLDVTPGKTKALLQVNEFLQWLDTTEEEGEEDDAD